jgi:hypothetical protein
MAGLLFLIPFLLVLAVIGAIVFGLVALVRRRRGFQEVDPGIGSVRRMYFYVVSFVALIMAASGVVVTALFVLDSIFVGSTVSGNTGLLATGLSLIIVGLPLWFFHWRIVTRYVAELPVEARSVLRKVYIYLVLGISAAFALTAAVAVLAFLLGDGDYSGYPWATLVVWAAVWAFHWRMESEEGQPTPETRSARRFYLYIVAFGLLSAAGFGAAQLIHGILREAYFGLTSEAVVLPSAGRLWTGDMQQALVLLLVVVPAWAVHWFRFAGPDGGSTVRQVYLYGFAVAGGAVTILIAAGVIIFGVLEWAIGLPDASTAAQFRFLPGGIASLIVAGAIFTYHRWVARSEDESWSTEAWAVRGAVLYASAAVGVVLTALAIGAVVETVFEAIEGSGAFSGADLWRDRLALTITFGILGVPMWAYYWTAIRRRVLSEGVEERLTTARKIFIFGVLGAGMLALLGSVSVLMFIFIRELLDGQISNVISDARGAIVVIVPAAIILIYHWFVYRDDRRLVPEADSADRPVLRKKAVTVLVAEGSAAFLEGLERALGYRVDLLQRVDAGSYVPYDSEEQADALARRIVDADGLNVLVVPEQDSISVFSYR